MSRAKKRRRQFLISLCFWTVFLAVWIVRITGFRPTALDAVGVVAAFGALGFTIAAAANS